MLERDGEPAALLDAWAGADAVLLIDAVRSGAEPGTVHRFDVTEEALPAELGGVSSHGLGVGRGGRAGARARAAARPAVLYGIEVSETGLGTRATPAVKRAVDEVAERVLSEAVLPRPPYRGAGQDGPAHPSSEPGFYRRALRGVTRSDHSRRLAA